MTSIYSDPLHKRKLDPSFYNPQGDELAFLKRQTGTQDDDKLEKHILGIQAKAYVFYGYPRIRHFSFLGLPGYRQALELLQRRENRHTDLGLTLSGMAPTISPVRGIFTAASVPLCSIPEYYSFSRMGAKKQGYYPSGVVAAPRISKWKKEALMADIPGRRGQNPRVFTGGRRYLTRWSRETGQVWCEGRRISCHGCCKGCFRKWA